MSGVVEGHGLQPCRKVSSEFTLLSGATVPKSCSLVVAPSGSI